MQIQLEKQVKEQVVTRIKTYFRDKLDLEIGAFDAEFLLDFLTKLVGPVFYNQGLLDARAVFENQIAAIDEALFAIEQPSEFGR
ncbi:MAG: DUF2164 domain-containing protein [Acidobacteria bacterium]|nr:DUF2164 domain-containing protein [Acidobacteriota bacterium]